MKLVSIRINILTHFILLILLSASVLIAVQYHFNKQAAIQASERSFETLFDRVQFRNEILNHQNLAILNLLEKHPDLQGEINESKLLRLFAENLSQFPKTYAIYLATEDDDFFEVINMGLNQNLIKRLEAPPSTAWTVIKVNPTLKADNYQFNYYDHNYQLLKSLYKTTSYAASQRSWYKNALKSPQAHQSKPYLFWHLNAPGITFSKQISPSRVLAVDYTVEHLTQLFEQLKPTKDSKIVLFDGLGTKFFESNIRSKNAQLVFENFELSEQEQKYIQDLPILKVSNQANWAPFDFVRNGNAKGFSIELLNAIAQKIDLKIQYVNDYSWDEILAEFKTGKIDLVHSLLRSKKRESLGVFSDPYFVVENYFITHQSLEAIDSESRLKSLRFALGRGWQSTELLLEKYPNLDYQLYDDLPALMQAVQNKQADVFVDNLQAFARNRQQYQMNRLKVNQPFSKFIPRKDYLYLLANFKHAPLVDILNRAIQSVEKHSYQRLQESWYLNSQADSLTISPYDSLFFELLNQLPIEDSAKFFKTNVMNETYIAAVSPIRYNQEVTYLATFVPQSTLMQPYYQQLSTLFGVLVMTLVVVLLLANYSSQVIVRPLNQLMYRNRLIAEREFEKVTPVETHIKELYELSNTLMTVSSSYRSYEENQEKFLQGLVRLIAEAIDKRSHHTYSHCSRVPKLGIMILQAAVSDQKGRFKEFNLSETEEKAFEIGAWLHDSGKITTPESILEKSTKLDAFTNRIHEIRMRFEVLWRDADILYYQQVAQKPENESQFKAERLARQQDLQDQFTFIANLNIGLENITEQTLAKLDQISEMSWQSHFDKFLGLSKFQMAQLPETRDRWEKVLQDFSEQIKHQDPSVKAFYKQQGFRVKVPKHEINLGEKYNLSIPMGTLTPEERFKMQDHVVMTLKLLEQVPLPEQYKNIAKYAGTHHEMLDGSGYPRQLIADQLGTPERIMVLADIFEALTAPDRPYKRTQMLSTAIETLYEMVENNQLDRDVFELFLRSGVYKDYAEAFIDPSQIDSVDINRYLHHTD